jgi:hypothetical protein
MGAVSLPARKRITQRITDVAHTEMHTLLVGLGTGGGEFESPRSDQ